MADKTESKPPFWSSMPGILTGVGGVIVALTGLVAALYTNGAIGSKANSNAAPPANTSVTLASVPSDSRTPSAENDRYRLYTGKWVVTEEPSLDFGGVKKVIWRYDASVSGNVLTMKGKVSEIDGNKNLPKGAEDVSSTIVVPLVNSRGMGDYKTTKTDGTFGVGIRLDDADPPGLHGTIEKAGKPICGLMGKKQ